MEYQKFDDPVALLIELCRPMSEKEKILLGALGYKLSKDPIFRKNYMHALKSFYMKNFQDMKTKKYVRRSFEELGKELKSNLEAKGACFIPEYAIFDPYENDKEKARKERVKILHGLLKKQRDKRN